MDELLDHEFESRQGADVDDLDGFEFGYDDETLDDEEEDDGTPFDVEDDELDLPWPSQEEIDYYNSRPPEPVQIDEERAQIARDWDKYGYLMELIDGR